MSFYYYMINDGNIFILLFYISEIELIEKRELFYLIYM